MLVCVHAGFALICADLFGGGVLLVVAPVYPGGHVGGSVSGVVGEPDYPDGVLGSVVPLVVDFGGFSEWDVL